MKKSGPLFGLVLLAGCGTMPSTFAVDQRYVIPGESRLSVNEYLVSRCPFSQDQIFGLIQLTEADRLDGISYTDALRAAYRDCETAECESCATAIISQIYGE